MKRIYSGFSLLIGFICIIVVLYTVHFVNTPSSPGKPLQVNILAGQSGWQIAKTLEKNRIITDAGMFMLASRILGKAKHLQAGTYVFEGNHYPVEVMNILFQGKTLKYRITIPEGSNIYQISEIIAKTGLMSKEHFIRTALSEKTTAFFHVDAPSMEGYLYPDTYFLTPRMTPLEIMAKLHDRFDQEYTEKIEQRAGEMGLSRTQVLTLASIIEKEAISSSDKPLISSVFFNRLSRGMRLQSDPTAVYGIDGFKGKIDPEDLQRESPYNTYRHNGLPPGPICNPGSESIRAVLWPARTDYLYFVSRGDGTHAFSSSLVEHNRAISENLRQRKKQPSL
jgi:UPF0755 protein